jgi:hypothetical protein
MAAHTYLVECRLDLVEGKRAAVGQGQAGTKQNRRRWPVSLAGEIS